MRVALVGPCYPLRGGIAHYNARLFHAFEEAGHQVKLLGMSRQYPGIFFPGTRQDDVSDQPIEAPAEIVVDSTNPLTWHRCRRRIRDFGADNVVFQWWHPFFAPSFGSIARMVHRDGARPVFLCHNVRPHEATRLDNALLRYAYGSVNHFLVHAEGEATRLRSQLAGRDIHVQVAPHPVYDIFKPSGDTRSEARQKLGLTAPHQLLFFGYVRRYKGLDILLDAMPEILEEVDCELTIAGECYEDAQAYQDQIRTLGLKDRVRFLDRYISNEEVPQLFRAADVCVLPYRHATQSGIVQVAYALDTPVIVSRVGGIPEAVGHNESGLLIEPEDSGAVAQAVRRYFNDDLRDRLVDGLRQRRAALGWNRVVEGLEALAAQ
jgi:glycosyltransferase involved in cell wall biosynthesis